MLYVAIAVIVAAAVSLKSLSERQRGWLVVATWLAAGWMSLFVAGLREAKGNESLLTRYRAADPAARKALLTELDRAPLPALRDVADQPTGLDVE
jgi:hypothetical protein